MKMWLKNVMILLLFCYACLSTCKGKVFFESKNFFNVLRWDPVEPDFPGQDVLYSVRNGIYGEEQTEIEQCQNISAVFCNLTEETKFVHDTQYVAQVYRNGKFLGSTIRFKPLTHTTLGPPILKKLTSESTLSIHVTLPSGPNGVSIADIIINGRKSSSKTVFLYTLTITQPKLDAHVSENTNGSFVLDLKQQGEYCGNVVYRPSPEWGRKESEKADFCVTLRHNPVHWILVGVGIVAGLIMLSAVCICTYVNGGKPKSTLQALEVQKATTGVMKFPDKNLIISELKVNSQIKLTSSVSEGYSSQGILAVAWSDSTGSSVSTGGDMAMPNSENTSAQASESYGAVVVHAPEERNRDFQANSEEGAVSDPLLSSNRTNWNLKILPGAPTFPDVESGESSPDRTLMLQTMRDQDGQLMLHIIGDCASPVSTERKPLLLDLIHCKDDPSFQNSDTSEWSDSGCEDSSITSPTQPYCNSNYIPTQPGGVYVQQQSQGRLTHDATLEPSYMPNWILSSRPDCKSTETCEDTRTYYLRSCAGLPTEEGHEDDDSSERVESLFALGKWGIQIQD
ncbi:unnamed protein product [Ophioblennius macclurei]